MSLPPTIAELERFRSLGTVDPSRAIRLATELFLQCYPDTKRTELIDKVELALAVIGSCGTADVLNSMPTDLADELARAIVAVAPDLIRKLPPLVSQKAVREGVVSLNWLARRFGRPPDEISGHVAIDTTFLDALSNVARLKDGLEGVKRRNANHRADVDATRARSA